MTEKELLQIIEDAKNKGLKELDLSYKELKRLPPEICRLTNLTLLYLYGNQLSSLPPEICRLTNLTELSLYDNQLSSLPPEIVRLTNLTVLNLSSNQLSSLPPEICRLTNLTVLNLSSNQLSSLPLEIGRLTNLTVLNLSNNQLSSLPPEIGRLTNLTRLYLHGNQLSSLPPEICRLTNLTVLNLSSNQLSSLPPEICRLTNLTGLSLNNNPLTSPPAEVVQQGTKAVLAYLRELSKGVKRRFEAKLLILGDGREGKTCVSRALRNLPFMTQVRTPGVEVVPWNFENPKFTGNKEKAITLNIWDFEGQEINHQSHQFFLTEGALYLLVINGRKPFRMDRAEYWLDTIRARAPASRVILVASECEDTTPSWPLDKLKANYGDLLKSEGWFYAVGCENGKGIDDLAENIKTAAAEMLGDGKDWPVTYTRAEEQIKKRAEQDAQVDRTVLYEMFKTGGISTEGFEDAAVQMHSLGLITQFKNSPALGDFVVLNPQWLTKGISKVMEDEQLDKDKGEITHKRMKEIWDNGYRGLYSVLHDCMREFELCYDMEDKQGCLVPLRFGDAKPQISWSDIRDAKERRIEYRLNTRPPVGIMSRFIVKTHHMIVKTPAMPKGVYWHNGVFLSSGEGEYRSEALCEFDNDERLLRIRVKAAFPQNMAEQLHSFAKAVFGFFDGLSPERSYGCIKFMDGNEEECVGAHPEMRILYALSKNKEVTCETGWHDVDARQLVYGFSSFGEKAVTVEELKKELAKQPPWAKELIEDVKTALVRIDKTYDEVVTIRKKSQVLPAEVAQQVQMQLRGYLGMFSETLDNREFNSAPAVVAIRPVDGSAFNPKNWFEKEYELIPYCECEAGVHPVNFSVRFKKSREWWEKTAPTVSKGMKVLSAGIKIACAGLPLGVNSEVFEAIQKETEFMKELADHLELEGGAESDISGESGEFVGKGERLRDLRDSGGKDGKDEKRIARMQLAELFKQIAPKEYEARQWGNLRRVHMPDNTYRWLCQTHAEERR